MAENEQRLGIVWSNWLLLVPFLGGVITLIPTAFVFENLWQGFPSIDFLEIDLQEVSFFISDMDAQTYLFLSQLILAVSSVATILFLGYVIAVSLNVISGIRLALLFVIFFLTILIALSVDTNQHYQDLFLPLFDQIRQIELTHDFPDPRFISRVEIHMKLISALVVIGIIMILGGFVTSIYTQRVSDTSLLQQLMSQRRRVLMALYSGAILLVCGVIATYAYVRIPAVFLADTDYTPYMHSISSSITLTFGMSFTICLAGGYLPTSMILSNRARSLAVGMKGEDPEFNVNEWLKEQNLTNSLVQNVVRAVAILSPFLVSLSQISKFFT